MECRVGCAACCIAPSISSPIPGMPHGKPAGMRCVQLTDDLLCKLYGALHRPQVCIDFQASLETCGSSQAQALRLLSKLESLTRG